MDITPIVVTYGSCISLLLTYRNISGEPEDITDDTIEVIGANKPAFGNAVISKIDPTQGQATFFLSSEDVSKLGMGNVNKFRLSRISSDGCRSNTTIIEVQVI